MRTLTVRQIDLEDGCKHVALHKINFPEIPDPGFYRTHISYAAFFESTKRRNWSEQYLFSVSDRDSMSYRSDYEMLRDRKLPVVEHTDLLAFFKHIGYDRKSKKFLP